MKFLKILVFTLFFPLISFGQYYIIRKQQIPSEYYIPMTTSVTVIAEGYEQWGNEAYIKWTTNNWASWNFSYMPCDWNGSYCNFKGVIPAPLKYCKVEYGVIINVDNTPGPPSEQLAWDFNNGQNYKFVFTNLGGGTVNVSLIQPNGGENIQGMYQIKWNATESQGASAYITNNIYWTTNNEINWNPIVLNYGNSGIYNWDTTSVPNGNKYKIKIFSRYSGETNSDISDNTFTINNSSGYIDIEIVQPNGGENVSGNYQIKWSAFESQGYSSYITNDLYWSTNNGINWNPIILNYNNNYNAGYFTYNWNTYSVPNSHNYKIKIVSHYKNETDNDISANFFTITNATGTPYLLVNNLGYSNVMVNSNFKIEVYINSNNIYNLFGANIGFELSQNNLSFEGIEVETNNSQFLFSDPEHNKRPIKYLYKSYINQNNRKVVNFGITFLATNGNFNNAVVSGIGKIARLKFKAVSYGICDLSFYNQIFYKNLVNPSNWVPYEITAINIFPAPQCRINVIGNSSPVLSIIYPKGGETLSGYINIKWSAYDPENDNYFIDIYLSSDSGLTWQEIATHLNKIPEQYYFNTSSYPDKNSYKLKIVATDIYNNSTIQVSGNFSIRNDYSYPVVTYIYPELTDESVVLPDFGINISTTNGIVIKFSKSMNTNLFSSGFKIINKNSGQIISNGNFIWSENNRKLIYHLPNGIFLDSNNEYVLKLDTRVISDIQGLPLQANYSNFYQVNFKSVIITNLGGVLKFNNCIVNIFPNILTENIYLKCEEINFNGILPYNKLKGSEIYKFEAIYDSNRNGKIDSSDNNLNNFNGFIEIKFKYLDEDDDGVVDNTRLYVNSLKIYRLENNEWKIVNDGGRNGVDKVSKYVIADVLYLGKFCVLGDEVNFNIDEIEVFPNPINFEEDNYLRFKKLPQNSIIKIYNLNGVLIRVLIPDESKTECKWYGKDSKGNKVSYGLYFYVIENSFSKKIGKIGILK